MTWPDGFEDKPLLLYYEEPDPDRWIRFDHIPRRWLRSLFKGRRHPGGQKLVFLNLVAGLRSLGVPHRINDYAYARRHPGEIACIVGKPYVLDRQGWRNPILFGASVFSHPIQDPNLLGRLPVKQVLVPGEWMRLMFEPYYGNRVRAWPVGIDTNYWTPNDSMVKEIDFLIYDKVRWEHDRYESELIQPIEKALYTRRLTFRKIRYGYYQPEDLRRELLRSRAMIFLCEHETQGLAYLQALSCNVPILAWDREGYWRDPAFFPHLVKFKSVTAVPYWDERCGLRFESIDVFEERLEDLVAKVKRGCWSPRDFILGRLTLAQCAREYLDIYDEVRRML